MIVYLGEQPLLYEFGFKGLILLTQNTRNYGEDLSFLLYCGLLKHQPWITFEQCKSINQSMSPEEKESLLQFANFHYSPFTNLEAAELYSRAVGEIGIQPDCFYSMNKEEVELAYQGFIQRKQLEANLGVLAINTSKQEYKPIRLIENQGYEVGTIKEREETFQTLGIEV